MASSLGHFNSIKMVANSAQMCLDENCVCVTFFVDDRVSANQEPSPMQKNVGKIVRQKIRPEKRKMEIQLQSEMPSDDFEISDSEKELGGKERLKHDGSDSEKLYEEIILSDDDLNNPVISFAKKCQVKTQLNIEISDISFYNSLVPQHDCIKFRSNFVEFMEKLSKL